MGLILPTIRTGALAVFWYVPSAIEGVLGDFERTLKQNHPAKWISIEKQLLALTEETRAQKLFQIMQELEQTEPQFMKQVQQQMAENSESESDSL